MNSMDRIQDYGDGRLSPEERAAMEKDPSLTAEADAFAEYRRVVSAVGQSEFVPLSRLEDKLATLARPARKPKWGWLMVPAAAAAAFAVTLFVVRPPSGPAVVAAADPMELERGAPVAEMEKPEFSLARGMVKQTAGFEVPNLDLRAKGGTLASVRIGKNWAAFDYTMDKERISLAVSSDDTPLRNNKGVVEMKGHKFMMGKGIGWKHGNLAYYLKGGSTLDLRKFMACTICCMCEGKVVLGTQQSVLVAMR